MRRSTTLLASALLLAGVLASPGAPGQTKAPYPGSVGGLKGASEPGLVFSQAAELTLPGAPTGPPLAAGEGWIVGTEAGVLAFSLEGELLWSREDLAPALLSPTLTRGGEKGDRVLWVSSSAGGGSLLALRSRSGKTVFRVELPSLPRTAPAFELPLEGGPGAPTGDGVPDELLLLLEDGTVRAYEPSSGDELWSTAVSDALAHPPLPLAPGIALVTRLPGSLEQVGTGLTSSRPLLAISDHSTPLVLDPAAVKKKHRSLFLSGRDGRLRSLRCKLKKSGARCHQRWSFRTGARVEAAPVVLSDRVLVASWDNGLYSLTRHRGHLRWKTLASHRVGLAPVVAGPLVFLAPRTAEAVQAFHLADGTAAGFYEAGVRQEIPWEPARRGTKLALLLSAPPRPGSEAERNGRHRLRLLEMSEAPPESTEDTGEARGEAAARDEEDERDGPEG